MRLTVLNVAFPLAPVGSSAAGGAEQIVTSLDEALVAAGHRSIVVAAAGSSVLGELWKLPSTDGCLLDDELRGTIQEALRRSLRKILDCRAVDLVHMHGIDFLNYLPEPGITVLVTLHLPVSWYPDTVFTLSRPDTYLHCVSYTQQRSVPARASLLPPIENGVPTEALSARHRKRQFAAALGRVCPEKGFHFALDAAKRARIGLLLAGRVFLYPEHQRYFVEKIAPRLDGMRRFIGLVGVIGKRRLLGSARCLLVPSVAAESSSLVAMEALACGTPVIAFRSGALPEIIEHGRTGFLVNDESEMADAILAAGDLNSEICRETACRRFSLGRMTAAYLELYSQLARKSDGKVPAPLTLLEQAAA
jgi:glycosyltransferase involved in cell wall biosynthesis